MGSSPGLRQSARSSFPFYDDSEILPAGHRYCCPDSGWRVLRVFGFNWHPAKIF